MDDVFSYKKNQLQDWAGFSNDYNPIHFSRKAVERIGFSDLVVHGMLAMMPLKERIAENMKCSRGLTININLRKPVFINETLWCDTRHAADLYKVWLRSDDGTKYLASARVLRKEEKELTPSDWTDFEALSNQTLEDDYHQFRGIFPYPDTHWVYLDAVLFKYFVKRNGGSALAKDTQEYLATQPDLKNAQGVMQTSHQIDVLPHDKDISANDLSSMKIYTKGLELSRTKTAVYGSVESYIELNGSIVICQRMGLVTTNIQEESE